MERACSWYPTKTEVSCVPMILEIQSAAKTQKAQKKRPAPEVRIRLTPMWPGRRGSGVDSGEGRVKIPRRRELRADAACDHARLEHYVRPQRRRDYMGARGSKDGSSYDKIILATVNGKNPATVSFTEKGTGMGGKGAWSGIGIESLSNIKVAISRLGEKKDEKNPAGAGEEGSREAGGYDLFKRGTVDEMIADIVGKESAPAKEAGVKGDLFSNLIPDTLDSRIARMAEKLAPVKKADDSVNGTVNAILFGAVSTTKDGRLDWSGGPSAYGNISTGGGNTRPSSTVCGRHLKDGRSSLSTASWSSH